MPEITFIAADGRTTVIDAPCGTSVMRAATSHGVDGIIGECGGQLMCSTCHVRVASDHESSLPEVSEEEDEMLDLAASERQPSSRLSCQIPITEELDGLVLSLPETQL